MSPTCSQPAAQGVSGGLRLSLKSSSEEAAAHPSPSPLPVAEETRPRLASWFPETPAVQEDYETEGDGSESQVSTITYERHESLMSVTSSPISIADKKRRSSTLNDAPGFKTTQKKLSEWNAEQVAEWAALTPLPLEVAEMLRAHAITGPVLEVLSEDDMVTIGLHKLGWRRQLDLSRQELLEQLESSATSEPQSSDPIEIHSDPCTPKSTATATSSPFGIRPACSPQNGAGRLPKTSKNAEQHASLRESRNGGRLAESIEGSPVASAIGRALDAGGDTFSVSRQPTIHVPPVPPVPPVQSPSRSISSSPPRAGAPCSHSMPLPTVPLLSSRPPRVSVTPLGRARATIGSPASHVARFGGVVRMPSESPVRTAPAQPSAPRRSLSPPPYSGKDASYGSLTPPRASVAVHSVRREQDAGYGSLTPPQGSLTPLRPPGKGGSAAAPSTSIAVRRRPEDAGYGSLTPPRGSLTPPVLRSLGQSASAAASSAPIGARRSGEATPIAPSTECPVTPKPSPQLHSSASQPAKGFAVARSQQQEAEDRRPSATPQLKPCASQPAKSFVATRLSRHGAEEWRSSVRGGSSLSMPGGGFLQAYPQSGADRSTPARPRCLRSGGGARTGLSPNCGSVVAPAMHPGASAIVVTSRAAASSAGVAPPLEARGNSLQAPAGTAGAAVKQPAPCAAVSQAQRSLSPLMTGGGISCPVSGPPLSRRCSSGGVLPGPAKVLSPAQAQANAPSRTGPPCMPGAWSPPVAVVTAHPPGAALIATSARAAVAWNQGVSTPMPAPPVGVVPLGCWSNDAAHCPGGPCSCPTCGR